MTGDSRSAGGQKARLRAVAEQLEALTQEIRRWSAETRRQADRIKLVQYRRQLAELVGECGKLGEACFEDSPELYSAFRSRFSTMRSQTAEHQAKWTAVSISPENSVAYHQSGQTVHATTIEFIAWLRASLPG